MIMTFKTMRARDRLDLAVLFAPFTPDRQDQNQVCWARLACDYRPAMAAVHLFSILPPIKPTNQMTGRLFGFS